jgi:hypothetical protein
MTRPVFLVGSVPFQDTEEVFTRCAQTLGELASRLPDGERHGWLPAEDFRKMRGLAEGRGESLLNPPVTRTLRMEEGVKPTDLEFETLHYFPNARASFEIFSRLKREGLIPPQTRYQVSIPSAFTGCIYFDYDQMRELWPAYEAALFRDVQRIVASIPNDELAIGWDIVEFGISLANPDPLERYEFDELADAISRAINIVAPTVQCGMHFCYGGHNSNGMPRAGLNRREIKDTALMAQFFNAIRARAKRKINWLHVPVPRPHGNAEYFEPLRDLKRDADTELYLGLLYVDDGVDRTKEKLKVAQSCVGAFGVAAACGLNPFVSGIPAERLPEILEYHRMIAELP